MRSQPIVIGTLDATWRVQDISADVHDLLGYPPTACIGVPVLDVIHPSDTPGALTHMSELAQDLTQSELELRLPRRPHGWQRTHVVVAPLIGRDQVPSSFAFLIEARDPAPQRPEDGRRLIDLELRLRRIAAEVRAAGVTPVPIPPSDPGDAETITSLTRRQQEVLARLMSGQRGPAIAQSLFLSESTVRNHLSTIFRRFGVHSQSQLLEHLTAPVAPAGTDEPAPNV